jgi:hypothetical protein
MGMAGVLGSAYRGRTLERTEAHAQKLQALLNPIFGWSSKRADPLDHERNTQPKEKNTMTNDLLSEYVPDSTDDVKRLAVSIVLGELDGVLDLEPRIAELGITEPGEVLYRLSVGRNDPGGKS